MEPVDHPDLERLASLIAALEPGSDEAIGLLLSGALEHSGYAEAPPESLCFAGTGGDGVHFSFLPASGLEVIDWPVVMTVPMQFDAPNLIVGANLREFLALGLNHGYFTLEQLAYDRTAALAELAQLPSRAGQPALVIQALGAIAACFAIAPWGEYQQRLAALQRSFPLL